MRRLHGLDALRGIAALMVFAHHSQVILRLPAVQFAAGSAVDLFFMLSGFVMARTYEQKLRDGMGTAKFLRLRYARLWLPMALGSFAGLIYFGLSRDNVLSFFCLLAFMPAFWLPGRLFLLNGPAYSLCVEICLNALHALLFVRTRLPVLIAVAAGAMLVYACIQYRGMELIGADASELGWTLLRGVSCYSTGIIIHRIYGDRQMPYAKWAIATYPILVLIAANLLPAFITALLFVAAAPFLLRSSLGLGESRFAYWAGALSFPLYAVHQPVLRLMREYPPIIATTVALVAAIVLTLATELPRRSMKRTRSTPDPVSHRWQTPRLRRLTKP